MAREIDLLGYWMPVLRQLKEFKEIAKAETPELKYILEQVERTLNSQIENRLLNLDGILDVADTQLNDVASNLALAQEEIPLLGGVYIG